MTDSTNPALDDVCQELAGQALVFGLLSRALYSSPDRAWMEALVRERVFEDVPFAGAQTDVVRGLALLAAWTAANQAGLTQEGFDAVQSDYTRLFVGPGKVGAPPWESVYFHDEEMLFQEETIQVREWYARFGLQIERLHSEPDDHLGLELAFLAHLAGQAVSACEQGEAEKLGRLTSAEQEFAAEHPLKWISAWCDRVATHARTDFYRGIALVAKGALTELDSGRQLRGEGL